mgnify:CR=1 FL=1
MKKKRGLVSCIQEFKKDTILTPIFVIGEVAFDVLIPMMTGRLLTQGVEAGNMERIFYYGGCIGMFSNFPFPTSTNSPPAVSLPA